MKQNIILFLCSICFLVAGCDFLDTNPGDAITGDHFWKTANADALEQYCNTYYPRLIKGHGNPNGWNLGPMIMQDFQSDNIHSAGANQIIFGQNTVTVSNSEWNWSTIRGCNAFLANYESSPAPEMDKRKYAGEILFFKAFDYFNKVRVFGDVPWYNNVMNEKDDSDLYKKRDSRHDVMDKVLETINQAIEYLPKKTKVYRVSKDAALLLKARICLYEGTWRRYRNIEGDEKYIMEAYNAAGELMKPDYGYSLFTSNGIEDNYFDLFIQDDYNNNTEVILSREYDPGINMGHDISNTLPLSQIGMSRDCYEEYLCSKTGLPTSLCSCHNPDMGYIEEMSNRDNRLLQTLCVPKKGSKFAHYLYREEVDGTIKGGAPNIFDVLPGSETRTFYGASCTGYAISKFYNASEHLQKSGHAGGIDAPVMRFAEVLLIRAEAGAELGLDPELSKTINLLRERVGFPFPLTAEPIEDPNLVSKYPIIKGPDANLIREIRRERRIELFAEGHRWDDICRWNVGEDLYNREFRGAKMDPELYTAEEIRVIKEKVGMNEEGYITPYKIRVPYEQNFKAKNYLYNIPLNEISLNPNLLPQNPGW